MPVGSDPRPGSEVAGYRLEELLGRGGMGAVYLAEDLQLRRKVALKLLAPELAENERFRDRFLRESQLAASLDHPHIVPIYAAGEADGQLYLAMRFVEGYDLRQLLASEGHLRPGPALALLDQVADALDASHEKGLIHRDVKPGNVLIAVRSGRRHCYLADFGLTKQTSSISGLTGTGELVSTVNYVSPEQIRGEAVDGRADVYALGCVLYECLTGEPPFARDSEVATLWAHVNEPPAAVAAVRPELGTEIDRVFRRALAKAPGDRYESCRELVASARAALGLVEPAAPALPRRRRARRLRLRHGRLRALVPAGAAALLAAAVALVLLLRGPEGLSRIGPTSVGVIDPATNELVADIPLGFTSNLIAAGEGYIWVVDPQRNTLMRMDPETMEIVPPTRRMPDEDTPIGLAVGEGSVWVAVNQRPTIAVHRFGVELGELWDTVTLETQPGSAVALAAGERAVWALEVGRGVVTRIDPATGTAERLEVDLGARSLAVGGGARLLGQALELEQVEGARAELDPVAGRLRDERVGAELPAQPVHVALHELLGGGRCALAPELVDEARRRDDLVGVQEQHSQ